MSLMPTLDFLHDRQLLVKLDVDEQGHVLRFSILGASRFKKGRPLEAELLAGN